MLPAAEKQYAVTRSTGSSGGSPPAIPARLSSPLRPLTCVILADHVCRRAVANISLPRLPRCCNLLSF